MYIVGINIVNDEDLAKDILQDVFLNLWTKRETLNIKNPKAYLLVSMKNAALKKLTIDKITESDEKYLESLPSLNATADETLEYEEKNNEILHLMNDFSKQRKEVFYKSRFQNKSNDEIAASMKLSKSTVEWHISKALKHLRHSLNEHYFIPIALYLLEYTPF